MNLASDVYCRHVHDFSDGPGVEIFQIEQHYFPIGWTQLMDELKQSFEIQMVVRIAEIISVVRHRFNFFQTRQPPIASLLSYDM